MKNTCAQSGFCAGCGEKIVRYAPTQNWYAVNNSLFWESYECPANGGGIHRLAAR